ncbi:hypothetical protein OXPF_25770 [Oxobacter pfennigii]|uniref:Uncharacterized protein n=1 Tax=Oxobacter pfennigii TaxID=36849 RepID=A0A0N8NT53_9CLOT|nr:hypothetical protein [Oxobacter pfennigii]KPU43872.1 hypothetical protein OXPF_25770 [Oxobacter pfennigii]
MPVIKRFPDGSFLEYDRGSFDDWCVYLTSPAGTRRPPRDTDYFQTIKDLAAKYGIDRVYSDYVSIYNVTGGQVEKKVLQQITQIAGRYLPEDVLAVDILFSILYMAMIAEERKANTRLGRRIKRLGIHYLLYEDATISHAANFMRGMNWRQISALCHERGF